MSKPEPQSPLWQSVGVAMDTQAKMKGIQQRHMLTWNEEEEEVSGRE